MVNREILVSHPISVLKKEISATNIKGYSKMKKAELVELMLRSENKAKFSHIEKALPKLSKKETAKKQKEGDDFVAAGADDISMDTIVITPKKRKRKPKAKKTISVTKADGSKKELNIKDKKKRAEIKLTTFKKK
jgi:hypothetical protein